MGFLLDAGNPPALRLHPLPLQGFYDQVATPLLKDVELQYPADAVLALTQHRHKQYYEGSEITVAGRIADNKLSSFKADVQASGVNRGLGSSERLQIHTAFHPCVPKIIPRVVPSAHHAAHTPGLLNIPQIYAS